MHESSLAKQILDTVLERAHAENATRVRMVKGWVGETESLSRESLAFQFSAHAKGTIAEHATLELDLNHVEAKCEECEMTYLPEHHLLFCPHCGSTEATLLGKVGLGIDTIDVE